MVLAARLGSEVFLERNLEVKELLAIGIAQQAQIEFAADERVRDPLKIVEEKAGVRGVRLDRESAVFRRSESRLQCP